MDRRSFLQSVAVTAAGYELLSSMASATPQTRKGSRKLSATAPVSIEGYTLLSEFKTNAGAWKVYEDLRSRDGSIVFVSSTGATRLLSKSAEASMPEGTPYLGLSLKEIGLSSPDLLADRLLQNGDPDPEAVKSAAPPLGSAEKNPRTWTTFVGTKEAFDVTPIYRSGNSRTYHPIQYSPELHEALGKGALYDGLVGGGCRQSAR